MKRALVVVVVVVVVALGASWWLLRARRTALVAPVRTAVPVASANRASTLTLAITATLDELRARLEREVPTTLQDLDEELAACVPATRLTRAVDCRLTGKVTRGALRVEGSGNVFRVTVPVAVRVTVRGKGELGRLIRETADGQLDIVASAIVDVAADWTPSVKVSADHRWRDPIGVDVLGVRITFAAQVNPTIERTLKKLEQDLPRQLDGLQLRARAAEAWQRSHAVVAVGAAPDVWLRFTPQSVAFRGYDIRDQRLSTTIHLTGATETFVGAKPPAVAAPPLPPLLREVAGRGFQFHLPVSIDYPVLERAAEQKLGRGTIQRVEVAGAGAVDVTVQRVTLFQSAPGGLAVGVDVVTGGARGLLAARGTIWFIARVAVENDTKRIVVSSLDVWGQTDSASVDLLVQLAKTPSLNAEIKRAMVYDFSREFDDALASANAAVADRPLPGGLSLQAHIDTVSAGAVEAGPTSLLTSFVAEGTAALSLVGAKAAR